MNARPVDALVAALASLGAALGLTTLTDSPSWFTRAVVLVALVAGLGALMRGIHTPRVLVVVGQLVVATWALLVLFAVDRLFFGLPGPAAWEQVGNLVADLSEVLTRYSAPVPASEGVQFLLVGGVALLAIVVDAVAVTWAAPGVAGLPLLATFLTAAANSGSALPVWYFVVAAVLWLALVARQGRWRVRRWSTTAASPDQPVPDEDVEREALGRYGSVARTLGVCAVLAAVLLPAIVPHLPTRYVLDGLGRSDDETGRGGRVGFNSTLDVTRSLQTGDRNVVLTYRTSASAAPPLRVVVASTYVGGNWRPRQQVASSQDITAVRDISEQVKTADRQLSVESNALSAPHVAIVPPVVSTDFGSTAWSVDPSTGDLYTQSRPDAYGLVYREVDVTGDQLKQGIPGANSGRADPEVQAATQIQAGIGAQVRAITATVTEGTSTAFDAAVAIQDWLREKGGFTYSLQLAPPTTDGNGAPITDPILNFLATKQGYCVQFASAMIMMARAEGIPARMAIGFLPGTSAEGLYTVRAADAHAWPELYFPGAGWLRFEPTPAIRTGQAPAYTLPTATAAPSATASATTSAATPTGSATTTGRNLDVPEDTSGAQIDLPLGTRVSLWFEDPWHLVWLAVVLGLLGALVLPVTAALVHRRRRASAASPAELAEAQWDELVSRLGDLGVPRPSGGGTLRQWRSHYTQTAYLDEDADAALGNVVATLERSRYARPDPASTGRLADDVRTVTRSASTGRPWTRRVRAFLLPRDGLRWWSTFSLRVVDTPGQWVDRLLERLPRRGRRG